jgi:uncharacterized membrane protein YgdD (TMEM256/DUF423 family)
MRSTQLNDTARDRENLRRGLRRVLLGTAAILLVPLVAMRFTREVNWGPLDFVAAAVLLAGTGSLYVLLTSKLRTPVQRRAIGGGLLLTLMLVWAELAVGIFGSPLAGS